MRANKFPLFAAVALFLVTMVGNVQVQGLLASVTGVVADENGGALPGVDVRLTSADGSTRTATSDNEGRFVFQNLAVGHYHLRAELTGFRAATREVEATLGQAAPLRFTLLIGSIVESVPAAGETPQEENHARIPVFYATDRNRMPSGVLSYGGEREPSNRLHFGRFIVSVPRRHETGHVERPDLWSFWKEDPDKHFIIVKREPLSDNGFYADLRAMVGTSKAKQAFVFIHGYNIAFEDAVYRTAQLASDLGFDGAPILYSWPSVGGWADYRIDEKNVEVTVERLRWFLEDVRRRSGATVVHLIAHSMGNRALTQALAKMEVPATGQAKFSQVVLTAPDIDAGLFPAVAAELKRIAGRITIYASEHDLALEAARKYDTFQRVGSTKPRLVLFDGVDVVDASKVDTSLLGHSYFGDSTKVLSDLYYVIQGAGPDRRAFIEARGLPPRIYWAFR